MYRVIYDRRASGFQADDLLALLLEARDEETGVSMSDRQLRDELVTIYIAGHETTAILLTWTFTLLSTHPEVERRLQAELVQVLGGRTPLFDDLPNLLYRCPLYRVKN